MFTLQLPVQLGNKPDRDTGGLEGGQRPSLQGKPARRVVRQLFLQSLLWMTQERTTGYPQ